jgi:CheY-like chemotaxis protein
MVVDDDDDIRDVLKDVLRDEGYHVVACANGRLAWEHLKAGYIPNLIILDAMMPIMSGFEFYHLKQGHPDFRAIPVLIISADVANANLDWVVNPEAVIEERDLSPALAKPLSLDRLLDSVKRWAS